jgi:7-cyano-7-deazaguanine synthase
MKSTAESIAGKSDKAAIVLLSGGMDSATTLALAIEQVFACHALSVDYGQRSRAELHAAAKLCHDHACEHRVVAMDLRAIGGSALTADIAVPDYRPDSAEIPVTYVPARNTLLLALALGFAESIHASDLFIGVTAVDYSGYPDCRPAFIAAFEELAQLATKAGIEGAEFRVHTPLISMSKAEIIRTGVRLGLNHADTVSCYQADNEGRACGRCDACCLRREGFVAAGVADQTRYRTELLDNDSSQPSTTRSAT